MEYFALHERFFHLLSHISGRFIQYNVAVNINSPLLLESFSTTENRNIFPEWSVYGWTRKRTAFAKRILVILFDFRRWYQQMLKSRFLVLENNDKLSSSGPNVHPFWTAFIILLWKITKSRNCLISSNFFVLLRCELAFWQALVMITKKRRTKRRGTRVYVNPDLYITIRHAPFSSVNQLIIVLQIYCGGLQTSTEIKCPLVQKNLWKYKNIFTRSIILFY